MLFRPNPNRTAPPHWERIPSSCTHTPYNQTDEIERYHGMNDTHSTVNFRASASKESVRNAP